MLKATFSECREIRMGSPYNLCDVTLTGEWVPELPYEDWQDIFAHSKDKRICNYSRGVATFSRARSFIYVF